MKYLLLFCFLFCAGCTQVELDNTGAILDILEPPAQPVCGPDSVGIVWQNKECLHFGKDTFEWTSCGESCDLNRSNK